jgi:amino acid adenylation domain-containing protein
MENTAYTLKTKKRNDSHSDLISMFLQQLSIQPNATAVIGHDGSCLDFKTLGDKALALAHAINQSHNICVGLYVDASVELLIGVWGIVFSGKAYLPLSTDYPDERIRYITEHSQVKTILTQAHLLGRIQSIAPPNTRCIALEDALQAPFESNTHSTLDAIQPNDLAYVIYTSGSTGNPKGVMVEHRNIAHQLNCLNKEGILLPHNRILQKTPMSFDAAQWEILAPAVGATVVAGSPDLYRDIHGLIERINAHGVTHLQCVPTLLHALVEEEAFLNCSSLRSVFSGGEALSQKLAHQFYQAHPQCHLVNLYGPTECTINATLHHVKANELQHPEQSVSIGQALSDCTAYLLNEKLEQVPNGQEGELFIGGPLVARGYLNDEKQTQERFITSPFKAEERLYRTGDLCTRRADGLLYFSGRVDHQVKLRGYRIELEEIATAIENHPWVRQAIVLVSDDQRNGNKVLNACVELNEKEAALMDQGLDSSHHQSKTNKLQVKAQLSSPGLRELSSEEENNLFHLPGAQASALLRQAVFSRKTYRFFEGGPVKVSDVHQLLSSCLNIKHSPKHHAELNIISLGHALRWMGSFHSPERLLPKYAYASPGALYATQMYLECTNLQGLDDGIYYYHPVRHALLFVAPSTIPSTGLRWHFVGKRSAIEPVYQLNIREVLEIETGHMVATLQEALAPLNLGLVPATPASYFGVAEDDMYLGLFEAAPLECNWKPSLDIYIQPVGQGIQGLENGTYLVEQDSFKKISDLSIQQRHVIAINQQVFERSSLGISLVCRTEHPDLHYIALGHALHLFQRNDLGFGFMSSGYSSKTGHALPAFKQLQHALAQTNRQADCGYFFIGGKVSEEQQRSEGMREDCVHMQGPAEMIREELIRALPEYMIPNRVLVFDRLPLTANGKVDRKAIASSPLLLNHSTVRPLVKPETPTEQWLADSWATTLRQETISREDDFFALGGNSLAAIALLHRINQHFSLTLPAQSLFEHAQLKDLAKHIDSRKGHEPRPSQPNHTRLIRLNTVQEGRPIFCWPGLGGYPLNLRKLAQNIPERRPFFGIQSHGLNAGETPYATIQQMANADVQEITAQQAHGPLTLWGYSFGARLAFETAWQLEQQGRTIDRLTLICPGNPNIDDHRSTQTQLRSSSLKNRTYVAILLSVFLGRVDLELTDRFIALDSNEVSLFVAFVQKQCPDLDPETMRRIIHLVGQTYEFEYSFKELENRTLQAPITLVKAQGDDYSFIESKHNYTQTTPLIFDLSTNHYEVLRSGVHQLMTKLYPSNQEQALAG